MWPPTCGQFTDVALVQKRLPGPAIVHQHIITLHHASIQCSTSALMLLLKATISCQKRNEFTSRHSRQVKAKLFRNIQRYTPITLHPKAPLYNIIIIVDTVRRQKLNFKHEKQLSEQYRHIATLSCTTKACLPPG